MGLYALRTGGVSFTGAGAAPGLDTGAGPAEAGHLLTRVNQQSVRYVQQWLGKCGSSTYNIFAYAVA